MAAVRCMWTGDWQGKVEGRAGADLQLAATPNPGSCSALLPQRLPAGDDVAGKAAADLRGGLPHNLHADVVWIGRAEPWMGPRKASRMAHHAQPNPAPLACPCWAALHLPA